MFNSDWKIRWIGLTCLKLERLGWSPHNTPKGVSSWGVLPSPFVRLEVGIYEGGPPLHLYNKSLRFIATRARKTEKSKKHKMQKGEFWHFFKFKGVPQASPQKFLLLTGRVVGGLRLHKYDRFGLIWKRAAEAKIDFSWNIRLNFAYNGQYTA